MSSDSRVPLRVAIVAPSLDIVGGQSIQAVQLVERLKSEPDLIIGFIPHNPRLPKLLRWLQRPKYIRTIVTSLLYWMNLLFRVRHYDIIHVFSASYYSYSLSVIPALLAARLWHKKSILNYRSGEAADHLANWRSAVPTIKLADKIVVPSGYLVQVFAEHGLKASAIANIVELDRFSFRERTQLRPVFMTNRLLQPLYNVQCILRAFQIIQQSYPDASLTIAGDGWLRASLEELARELDLHNVRFIGFVDFKDMPRLYEEADIYLCATNIDNTPSSIAESMAAGLNIVTTDGGGSIPFMMTNEVDGIIVDCDDDKALAAGALRLLRDNDLAVKLARNARETSKKFGWTHVRDAWVAMYFKLVEQQGSLTVTDSAAEETFAKHDSRV